MKCLKCNFENPDDTHFCGKCGTQLKPSKDVSATQTSDFEQARIEPSRGRTLSGRYEIIEELGRGGMGNVYRVFDKKINEEMALKILHPAIAADRKTIERFKNELKFTRKVIHKNVCRMYDLNEEEGTPYITMEYVPGEDLKGMIRMMGQLSVSKAIFVAKQVSEGLLEAHRLGVVHRDLKPRNIMIDKDGNARIMDFGIARSLKAEGMTGSGIMVGTPEYMSPEQVKGEEADQRSDIYGLGVILFEMVTGRIPFKGDTSLSIALKHKTDPPPNPRTFNSQIPEELSRAILKCMEKEKEKRYQSVEELISELSRIENKISKEETIQLQRKTKVISPAKKPRLFLIASITLPAVLLFVIGYLFLSRVFQSGEMKWSNSIAVLPFRNYSPQKEYEYLCFSMAEAIAQKLTQIEEMKVISKTSVMRYKDTEKDIRDIGKELQVKTILDCSLQVQNDTIRVNATLSSAEDGFQIWSNTYEPKGKSILEIQDEISLDIAKELKVVLLPGKTDVLKAKEPSNAEAYEYYAKGKYYIENIFSDSNKKEDFETGVMMYKKALEVDPNYALAYWALGNAYESRFNKEEEQQDLFSMFENYRKAYEMNPNLAETNVGMGWVHFYQLDNDKAFLFFKRAYEVEPDNPSINYDIGSFLRSIGLYGEAIDSYSKAIELDPLNTLAHRLRASCFLYMGEFESAAVYLQKALEIFPQDLFLLRYSFMLFIFWKDYEGAEKVLARIEKVGPESKTVRYSQAWLWAAKGEKKKALELIEGLEPYSYTATSIYSLLGMKDEAIQNIIKGIEEGFKYTKEYLYSYPFLVNNSCYDSLRQEPRFKEIVEKEKKKYREKLKKYGKL